MTSTLLMKWEFEELVGGSSSDHLRVFHDKYFVNEVRA